MRPRRRLRKGDTICFMFLNERGCCTLSFGPDLTISAINKKDSKSYFEHLSKADAHTMASLIAALRGWDIKVVENRNDKLLFRLI